MRYDAFQNGVCHGTISVNNMESWTKWPLRVRGYTQEVYNRVQSDIQSLIGKQNQRMGKIYCSDIISKQLYANGRVDGYM